MKCGEEGRGLHVRQARAATVDDAGVGNDQEDPASRKSFAAAPRLEAGARDVRGEVTDVTKCTWQPVGTPSEYLEANLAPPQLSYIDADAVARAAHQLKSSSAQVGAERLSLVSKDLESHARLGALPEIEALLESFEIEFEEACEALASEQFGASL